MANKAHRELGWAFVITCLGLMAAGFYLGGRAPGDEPIPRPLIGLVCGSAAFATVLLWVFLLRLKYRADDVDPRQIAMHTSGMRVFIRFIPLFIIMFIFVMPFCMEFIQVLINEYYVDLLNAAALPFEGDFWEKHPVWSGIVVIIGLLAFGNLASFWEDASVAKRLRREQRNL